MPTSWAAGSSWGLQTHSCWTRQGHKWAAHLLQAQPLPSSTHRGRSTGTLQEKQSWHAAEALDAHLWGGDAAAGGSGNYVLTDDAGHASLRLSPTWTLKI